MDPRRSPVPLLVSLAEALLDCDALAPSGVFEISNLVPPTCLGSNLTRAEVLVRTG